MPIDNVPSEEAGKLLLTLFKEHLKKELRKKIMEEIDPIIDDRIDTVIKELNAEFVNNLSYERQGLMVNLITHHKVVHEHHVTKRS